jgi:hypothetical protein
VIQLILIHANQFAYRPIQSLTQIPASAQLIASALQDSAIMDYANHLAQQLKLVDNIVMDVIAQWTMNANLLIAIPLHLVVSLVVTEAIQLEIIL